MERSEVILIYIIIQPNEEETIKHNAEEAQYFRVLIAICKSSDFQSADRKSFAYELQNKGLFRTYM